MDGVDEGSSDPQTIEEVSAVLAPLFSAATIEDEEDSEPDAVTNEDDEEAKDAARCALILPVAIGVAVDDDDDDEARPERAANVALLLLLLLTLLLVFDGSVNGSDETLALFSFLVKVYDTPAEVRFILSIEAALPSCTGLTVVVVAVDGVINAFKVEEDAPSLTLLLLHVDDLEIVVLPLFFSTPCCNPAWLETTAGDDTNGCPLMEYCCCNCCLPDLARPFLRDTTD